MTLFDMLLFFAIVSLSVLAGYLLGYSKGFLDQITEYEDTIRRLKAQYEYKIAQLNQDIDNEGWKRGR